MTTKMTHSELEADYDQMLNECYGVMGYVSIAGHGYEVARVLREVDPIAYRVGLSDHANILMENGHEIEGWD